MRANLGTLLQNEKMTLKNGLQLILQTEHPSGSYLCEGFTGLPLRKPVQLILLTNGTPAGLRHSQDLRNALVRNLLAAGGATHHQAHAMPCCGTIGSPSGCHALSDQSCRTIVAYCGDFTRPSALPQWLTALKRRGGKDAPSIIPLLPQGADPTTCLPGTIPGRQNVGFWTHSAGNMAGAVLAEAGICPSEFRIFISYCRADGARMAMQLFGGLNERNFSCFLDQCTQAPGVDFTHAIFDALADKAFLLLIETPGVLRSAWTQAELAFARGHGIPILSLHVPGRHRSPEVRPAERIFLAPDMMTGRGANRRLRDPSAILAEIQNTHATAMLVRRTHQLMGLRVTLEHHGIQVALGRGGLIEARSGINRYHLHACERPPVLRDFHHCAINSAGVGHSAVVGLIAPLLSQRREEGRWLSQQSSIGMFDEVTETRRLARRIARGGGLL